MMMMGRCQAAACSFFPAARPPSGEGGSGLKAKGVLVDNNRRSTMRLWGSWSRSVVW